MIVIAGLNGNVDELVGIESEPVVKKIEKRSIKRFADAIGDRKTCPSVFLSGAGGEMTGIFSEGRTSAPHNRLH